MEAVEVHIQPRITNKSAPTAARVTANKAEQLSWTSFIWITEASDHNSTRPKFVMLKKIDLTITHDYLNPFASPDAPKLSPELADYLLDSAWYYPKLCLQINCPENERERLQQAISNTFAEKSEQVRGDILILQLEALTLLSLALAVGLIGNALGIESTIPVAVFTVTVWMLLWRSAEIFFLDIRSAYRELRKYRRIASATKQY